MKMKEKRKVSKHTYMAKTLRMKEYDNKDNFYALPSNQ